jgi:hypothetical protein
VTPGFEEKSHRAVNGQQVIDKRNRGDGENGVLDDREYRYTSSVAKAFLAGRKPVPCAREPNSTKTKRFQTG